MIGKEIINKPLQKIKETYNEKENDIYPLILRRKYISSKKDGYFHIQKKICFLAHLLFNLCSYYIMYKLHISV